MRHLPAMTAMLCLLGCGAPSPDSSPSADGAPPSTPPARADETIADLSDSEIRYRFLQIWSDNPEGPMQNTYLGIRTWQNPLDVWITQEIFFEVKPDVVVEAGTFRGGSALLWATLLQPIDPDAEVITIDIQDKRAPEALDHPLAEKITFLNGSSIDPAIVAQVEERVRGKRVVVILDSLHTAEHVLAELRAYSPFVDVGSYIIVQDTIVGGIYGVRQFLEETDDFELDRSRERLLITNNIEGFLKRVR